MDNNVGMAQRYEHEIPEGYEARIEGNKVILERKESEDERIRKCLATIVKVNKNSSFGLECNHGATWDEMLAYLERRKEQNEIFDVDKFFAGKDVTDFKKELFFLIRGARELKPTDEEIWLNIENQIAPNLIDILQKGHQPAEWSEDFQENIRILLHDKLTWHSDNGRMSSAVLIDDKTLKDIISGIWFYVGKEALKYPNKELSQPEWSEEDKYILEDAITAIDMHLTDEFKEIHPNLFKAFLAAKDFLKSLPKKFNLQPRQEWGKEDEETLACAISVFEDFAECKNVSVPPAESKRYLKRLKSLRPQSKQEWSEKDKLHLNNAILAAEKEWGTGNYTVKFLKSLSERFNLQPKQEWSEEDNMLMDELESYILYDKEFNDEQKSWRIKRLKSLRPQPHWKPSKKQMEILGRACIGDTLITEWDVLNSLYNDLKKL